MERTFMMIKPDGVQRGLIGHVISRIESRGMKIVGMKIISVSLVQAKEHYMEHVEKDFYQPLLDFITSGPVIAMIIEGRDCIAQIRKMAGKTDPVEASPGTIRCDFGQSKRLNVVHAADSVKSAEREIKIYFKPDEILKYNLDSLKWILGE